MTNEQHFNSVNLWLCDCVPVSEWLSKQINCKWEHLVFLFLQINDSITTYTSRCLMRWFCLHEFHLSCIKWGKLREIPQHGEANTNTNTIAIQVRLLLIFVEFSRYELLAAAVIPGISSEWQNKQCFWRRLSLEKKWEPWWTDIFFISRQFQIAPKVISHYLTCRASNQNECCEIGTVGREQCSLAKSISLN